MNRIVIDNNIKNSDAITIDIKDNLTYLINNSRNKYIINVTNFLAIFFGKPSRLCYFCRNIHEY